MIISNDTGQNQEPPSNILAERSNIPPICLLESRRGFGEGHDVLTSLEGQIRPPTPIFADFFWWKVGLDNPDWKRFHLEQFVF